MVIFPAEATGGAPWSALRRNVTPSATHPGVKYVTRNVLNYTVLVNVCSSDRMTLPRVNGQCVATKTPTQPIAAATRTSPILIQRANTTPLSRHFRSHISYAVAALPLKKCRRSITIPTTSRMWMRPLETWKAKSPSNQRTIRTAAIVANMSSTPFISECAPTRNPFVTHGTNADSSLDSCWSSQSCQTRDLKSVRYDSHS